MSDPSSAQPQVCYRHPDRETGIRCQRCERPICPDCMKPAAVGFQCPSCVKEGAKSVRSPRRPYGGSLGGNPGITTSVLIAVNVLVWILIRSDGTNGSLVRSLWLLPQSPFQGTPGDPFDSVAGGEYWQVLTSAFTHIEVVHIGLNMVLLYFLGPQLEQILGRARFLALYLVSALTGSAAVMLLSDPNTPTLGASGATFGLIGAAIVLAHKTRSDLQPYVVFLGISLLYTFVGPRDDISWQAHLGGLIGGVLVAAAIAYAPKGDKRSVLQWSAVAAVSTIAIALVVVRAVTLA